MRTAQQRIDAYNARMQSSQIDPTLTAVNSMQQSNHTDHVNYFYPKQTTLRGWLDGAGIHGADAFAFEAFNGECYSIDRRFKGPSAVAQCAVLVAKYVAMGLTEADLIAVALAVWGWIVAPAVP